MVFNHDVYTSTYSKSSKHQSQGLRFFSGSCYKKEKERVENLFKNTHTHKARQWGKSSLPENYFILTEYILSSVQFSL